MTVSYGNGKRLGSDFVDVGLVGVDGRIMT
jgi:hypothetical protein